MKRRLHAALAALLSVLIGFIRDDGPDLVPPSVEDPDAVRGFDLYIDSDNLTYKCQGCGQIAAFTWYSDRQTVRRTLAVHRLRCKKPIVGAVLSAGRNG